MRALLAASVALLLLAAHSAEVEAAPASAGILLGAEVVDEQGKRIGVVDDLAVDVANAEVRYAMIRAHDATPGERVRGVPLQALSPGYARNQLVLREQPGIAAGGRTVGPQPPRMMRASTILGRKVTARGGDEYRVRDLIVDLDTGEVRSAIVAPPGAVLERLRELPLSALDLDRY